MKTVLRLVAVIALLVVIAAGAVVILLARGGSGLDNWLAQQVVGIANYYLVPEIKFERFRYEAPGTLTLEEATLTAPDGTVVVDATEIIVVFARTPVKGQPIEIERVTLVSPKVNLIQDDAGNFKGLMPFVRTQRVKEQDRAPSDKQLSTVLRIRHLTMKNGGMVFDPAGDQPPMELDGLAMDMVIEPANAAGEEGAWYAVAAHADRSPVFVFSLEGRFDIDNLVADIQNFSIDTTLDDASYSALPPPLQEQLREHEARGQFSLDMKGTVPLRDTDSMDLSANIRLEEFNFAQGEYRFPIELAAIDATFKDGLGTLSNTQVLAMGGRVLVSSATINLRDDKMPANLMWKMENINLQDLLRLKPADQPPKFAGILHGEGRVSVDAAAPKETVDGWGTLALREGRLVNFPLVTGFMNIFNVVQNLSGKPGGKYTDTADIEFDLDPKEVEIEKVNIVTQFAVVRGASNPVGTITYEGIMDLRVNAGPLEKMQQMLGVIGKVIGAVTDQIASYRVHGDIGKPKITPQLLGIGGR
jgi:hypothetical protein